MRKLLILDLDETLIHGRPGSVGADFMAAGIPVFIRPGARELFPNPVKFLWHRKRCVQRLNPETGEMEFVKDLKKIRRQGWDLAHVLVVDDTASKLARNYGNLVRVSPYTGEPDDVLTHLAAFLTLLSKEPDVRRIEKRGWLASLD